MLQKFENIKLSYNKYTPFQTNSVKISQILYKKRENLKYFFLISKFKLFDKFREN